MKIQLIACDLDGTLYYHQGNSLGGLSPRNEAALRKYIASGGRFIVATGRHPFAGRFLAKQLNLPIESIGLNGGALDIGGKMISLATLPRSIGLSLIDLLTPHFEEIHPLSYDIDLTRVLGEPGAWPTPIVQKFIAQDGGTPIVNHSLKEHLLDPSTKDPSKIIMFCKTIEIRDYWVEQLRIKFAGQCEIFTSSAQLIELMPLGHNKGTGLIYYANHYHIPLNEIAVIGDAGNDIPLFQLTPHSYVMRHGEPQVKKEAHYVVEDVAEAIEHILHSI